MDGMDPYLGQNYPQYNVPVPPKGLEAIYNMCRRLYQDQANPLQVSAVVKYWLGGPDPLDYISMYANPGDPDKGIPAHWHYISFGLSDLHGDGRVHECCGPDGMSGFGFELTFRLRRETGESCPPTWPAALMQSLARYVYQSENTLCVGDHIPWHSPLDGNDSRIQHMLMTEDPQLQPVNTPYGSVQFVQIVGVCAEELRSAQHWNGPGVLDLMKSIPVAGGPWMVTDMRRGETIFEQDPSVQDQVDMGIDSEGSNLSGVTSRCIWEEMPHTETTRAYDTDDNNRENQRYITGDRRGSVEMEKSLISSQERAQIKATLKKGLVHNVLPPIIGEEQEVLNNNVNTNTENNKNMSSSRKHSVGSISSEAPTEFLRTRSLDCIHLRFNMEAGALLPLALKGRLRHGRHFTYKSVINEMAITLVASSVTGSIADEQHPYAAHGPWLQVLLTDDTIDEMLEDLNELTEIDVDVISATSEQSERVADIISERMDKNHIPIHPLLQPFYYMTSFWKENNSVT